MIRLVWKMARPRSVALLWIFVVIGEAATLEGPDLSPWLPAALLAIAAWYVNATCVNDLADEEIDKVNLRSDKQRPLVDASGSRRQLIALAVISAVVAVSSAYLVQPSGAFMVAVALLLNLAYSLPPIRVSYRGFLAPMLLPLGYVGLTFLLGAGLHDFRLDSADWLVFAGLYVSFIGRLLLKDFRDVEGDRRFGKRTFLVRHGPVTTVRAAIFFWLLGDILISAAYLGDPWFVIALQPFAAAIAVMLHRLGTERRLDIQLRLITLIGRLANGAAILVLTHLSWDALADTSVPEPVILLSLTAVLVAACYPNYADVRYRQRQHG